jgi:parallel beta-helix repeat protein
MLLIKGRREASLITLLTPPHLPRKAALLMRRTIVLLATMALTLLVASGVALAVVIGSAGAQSSVVGPGESIQKAINAADPGDTIVVRGVHREDVVIRKDGIKLRGEDDAVIEAPPRDKADSPCSKTFGPEAICVLGDVNIKTGELTGQRVSDVSVSGFTIRGFKIKGKGDNTAFVIDVIAARNATVVGNRITGNVASGIVDGRSVNTTIAKNHVIGSPETPEHGIIVESSSSTKIVNNVVRSYVFGIEVTKGTNTTIAGNDSIGNSVDGFGVIDSPGTKILSNVARRNEVVGIFLGTQRANAKVVGNDLSGSEFGIFVADAHRGSFAANEAHNNCAGVVFQADFGGSVGNFEVKGNQVENNTRKCPAEQGREAFSGIGIGLFGASGMEVTGNHLSGNVPSGPTAVSGGVVVGVDPLFGGTTKPMNNSVIGNHFGHNKPDIFWDESGSGNRFVGNLCNSSVPSRLCN